MKNLLIFAVFMAVVVTGESLICTSCNIGFRGKCIFSSTETCNNTLFKCYSGNLVFNITEMVSLHTRGCRPSPSCNATERGTLLTAGYMVKRDCCDTDNCNGATSVQLSLAAVLASAITVVWH